MFNNKNNSKLCPLLKKPCIGSDCMWATRMIGKNPQTDQDVDDESCAVVWLPMLLVENVKSSNETGAAIESLRNETLKTQERLNGIQVRAIRDIAQQRMASISLVNGG